MQEHHRDRSLHDQRHQHQSYRAAQNSDGQQHVRITEETVPLLGDESQSSSRECRQTVDRPSDGTEIRGSEDRESSCSWRRPSILWILLPLFINMVATGGMIILQVSLIQDLICRDYWFRNDPAMPKDLVINGESNDNDRQCATPQIEAAVAKFLMSCQVLTGVLSCLTSPRLGALSDRKGRLRILALASCGRIPGEVATILAARYPAVFGLHWVYVCAVLDGLCGSSVTSLNMAHSYIADCTTPLQRSTAFNYLHACISAGVTLGPFLVGLIIRRTSMGLEAIYIGVLTCDVAFVLLTAIVPESRTKPVSDAGNPSPAASPTLHDDRAGRRWMRRAWAVVKATLQPLEILYNSEGSDSGNKLGFNLVLLTVLDIITSAVSSGSLNIIIIYPRRQFQWGAADQSLFISAVNASRLTCLMLAGPLLARALCAWQTRRMVVVSRGEPVVHGGDWADRAIIGVSILSDALGQAGYAIASTSRAYVLSGIVGSFGAMSSPAIRSALTKNVHPDRVGQLLGAMSLVHSITGFTAPILCNSVFSATAEGFRQAEFVMSACLLGLAFGLVWLLGPAKTAASSAGRAGSRID